MSRTVNKITLLGRLGKDPEIKYTPNNVPVCSFSLATGDSYTDKQGQKVETTEWHNIQIWEKLAEVANQYLKKGSQVYLEGRVKYETYEKDGVKKYITKIVANNLVFLGEKETIKDDGAEIVYSKDFTPPIEEKNDLPF